MKKASVAGLAILAGVVVLMAGLLGCEKNDGDGTNYLTVYPASVTMGTNVLWVTLTVIDGTRDLSLPLKWSVANSDLGLVPPQTAGLSAIYQRSTLIGFNTVTVEDQYGAQGYVQINQVNYNTVVPNTTPPTTTNKAVKVWFPE